LGAATQAPDLERRASSQRDVDSPERQELEKSKQTKARKEMKQAGELSRWKYVNPIFILKKAWKITSGILKFLATPSSWGPKSRELWAHIKEDAKHYWKGTKLLWADIKVISKLCRTKLLRGKSLTWREREQLMRTLGDCGRMLPFSVFIIIPALEIFLPLAIFLFPGLLPSTFEKAKDREAKIKARLQIQGHVAGFFQEFLNDQVRVIKARDTSDPNFVAGIEKIVEQMREGTPIRTETTLKIARMFDDHITIDNFGTDQLDQLCKFNNIGTFARSDAWKRRALIKKMRDLKADDKLMRDDIENMTIAECNKALRDRGMRGDDDVKFARERLRGWLRLSLDEKVPVTMLMLSRTFNIRLTSFKGRDRWKEKPVKEAVTEQEEMRNNLQEVIGKELPKTSVDQMLVEKAGVKNMEVEVEVIKRQDKIIEEETLLATEEPEKTAKVEKPAKAKEAKTKPAKKTKPKPAKEAKSKPVEEAKPTAAAPSEPAQEEEEDEGTEALDEEEDEEEKAETLRRAKTEEAALKEAMKQAKQSNVEAQQQLKEIEEKEEIQEKQEIVEEETVLDAKASPEQVAEPAPEEELHSATAEEPDIAEEIGKDEELYQLQAEVIKNWSAQTNANRLSKQVLKMMEKIENDIKKGAEEAKEELTSASMADTDPTELAERVESIYNKDPEKWKEVDTSSETKRRRKGPHEVKDAK